MKLKILMLAEAYSANTMTWVEGLRNHDCEVVLAAVRKKKNDEAHQIGSTLLPPRLRIIFGVGDLKRLISKVNPDILIAYRVASYGYLAARSNFHPLVFAAMNERIIAAPKFSGIHEMLNILVRYSLKKTDMIHAWNSNIADGLKKFGADEKKILTLHRGIDMNIIREKLKTESRKSFDTESPIFISSRSLCRIYQIDKLIKGFAEFIQRKPKARLLIAGDGPQKKNLLKLCTKLKLMNNVDFLGRLSRGQLTEKLVNSDIYISLVQTEGMSSSLIEALAAEVLPIVSDIPSSRELIDNEKNGFLAESLNKEYLSDLMEKAVVNLPKIKKEIIKSSQKTQKKFDREKNQKVFLEKYKKLISQYKK